MRRFQSISLLLTIAFATSASAAGTFDVHLIEPAAQIDLIAGSTISIAWEATKG